MGLMIGEIRAHKEVEYGASSPELLEEAYVIANAKMNKIIRDVSQAWGLKTSTIKQPQRRDNLEPEK